MSEICCNFVLPKDEGAYTPNQYCSKTEQKETFHEKSL